LDSPGHRGDFDYRYPVRPEHKTHNPPFKFSMSPVLIFVGIILAIGIWGYVQQGDPLFVLDKLTASDIAQYAANAGFTGSDLITAVAIALAESGGDPNAVGDNGTSIGLWQIHFTVHPEFDQSRLADPSYNAGAAYSIYSAGGGSFRAWSTFTVPNSSGVLPYQNFLGQAQTAVGT